MYFLCLKSTFRPRTIEYVVDYTGACNTPSGIEGLYKKSCNMRNAFQRTSL